MVKACHDYEETEGEQGKRNDVNNKFQMNLSIGWHLMRTYARDVFFKLAGFDDGRQKWRNQLKLVLYKSTELKNENRKSSVILSSTAANIKSNSINNYIMDYMKNMIKMVRQ